MSMDTLERELQAANPVAGPALAALELGECEEALGRALMAEPAATPEPAPRSRPRRRLLLAAAGAAAAVAIAVLLLGGNRVAEQPSSAYGAELVRYAESTPLLLLDEPGWRVNSLVQVDGGHGVLGTVTDKGPVKQRWVQLSWYPAGLTEELFRGTLHPRRDRTPGRRFWTRLPNLGARVHIDTRAESAPQYGRPGDREMNALWKEGGQVMFLTSRVPSLAAFRERLQWLRRVDAQTWLDAMPRRVVKAAEHSTTVAEMLRGIPLPPGFDPSQVPHAGLTTDRYQVGAEVGGAVACAWFRRWGQARAAGDTSAAAEAERVLLGSEEQWPIFREMAKEGAYPATVIEYARKLRGGTWFGRPVLRAVFSEGGLCAPGTAAGEG